MKQVDFSSNFFSVFGMLFYAVFILSKNAFKWPGFIANNYEFIAFGSIGLGYVMAIIYYFMTKNAKRAKELLLAAAIITAVCVALYFSAKL